MRRVSLVVVLLVLLVLIPAHASAWTSGNGL